MDIIKLAHLYETNSICAEFNLKSFYCGTADNATSGPPILEIKLCDNKPDCPYAQDRDPLTWKTQAEPIRVPSDVWISEQDEDGTLAKCKPTGKVKNDCCATYLVGSSEYDHVGDGEKSEKQKYNSITEGKIF